MFQLGHALAMLAFTLSAVLSQLLADAATELVRLLQHGVRHRDGVEDIAQDAVVLGRWRADRREDLGEGWVGVLAGPELAGLHAQVGDLLGLLLRDLPVVGRAGGGHARAGTG
eukprot:5467190-Alexandrium_andersonii.AAC.1